MGAAAARHSPIVHQKMIQSEKRRKLTPLDLAQETGKMSYGPQVSIT